MSAMSVIYSHTALTSGSTTAAAAASAVQVTDGFDVVSNIEGQRVGPMDRPVNQCRIADCGEL